MKLSFDRTKVTFPAFDFANRNYFHIFARKL